MSTVERGPERGAFASSEAHRGRGAGARYGRKKQPAERLLSEQALAGRLTADGVRS
jgi:hypothetical protein